jgi:hypothetical protein
VLATALCAQLLRIRTNCRGGTATFWRHHKCLRRLLACGPATAEGEAITAASPRQFDFASYSTVPSPLFMRECCKVILPSSVAASASLLLAGWRMSAKLL